MEIAKIQKTEIQKKQIADRINEIQENIYADNTNNTYILQQTKFKDYCGLNGYPLNETSLFMYLSELSNSKSLNTIKTVFYAISKLVPVSNEDKFKLFFKGLTNTFAKEGKTSKPAKALQKTTLNEMLNFGKTNLDIRNKAIFLLSYYGAFRVSELVNLKRSDITETNKGLSILVRNSKTDKNKQGMYKAIFYKSENCPVKALKELLQLHDCEYVFTTVGNGSTFKDARLARQDVHRIIKKINPDFSAHSFRAGFITDANEKGCSIISIMNQTGHKTTQMIVHYNRSTSIFTNNASESL